MFSKRWFIRTLCVCVLFLMGIASVSHAATQGEIRGLLWSVDDQGMLTVTGDGMLSESAFIDRLDITSARLEEGVTGVGNFAFVRCRNLESLHLPQSLETFGVNVVASSSQLQAIEVPDANPNFSSDGGILYDKNQKTLLAFPGGRKTASLPQSLETIGMYSFSGASVEELVLPQGLKSIEEGAFSMVPALKTLEIPAGVTALGTALFIESPNLTSVSFLNEAETLPASTFASCGKLEEIVFPKGVKNIGMHAFQYCTSLKSIEIPDTVERLEDYALCFCVRLNYLELPSSLRSIGTRTFMNDYDLSSITIPASVTFIGEGAFFSCISLTDVYYEGTEEQWATITIEGDNECLLGANIHYGAEMPDSSKITDDEESITLPSRFGNMTWTDHSVVWNEGTIEWRYDESSSTLTLNGTGKIPPMDPENCIGWKIYNLKAEHLVIGKGITGIGFQAFGTFRRLKTVSLPSGLTGIDYAAFADCNALTKISFPKGLTQFETYVFSGCSNLTSVEFPDGLEVLPDCLFQHCSRLSSVTIPGSVREIGIGVFHLCDSLTDVYYEGSEAEWGQITIGESNPWVSTAAFHYSAAAPVDLSRYTVLQLPPETLIVDAEAFVDVAAEVVVVPASCRQIGSRAFADCSNLVYVIIPPDSTVQVAEDALEGSGAVIRYQ